MYFEQLIQACEQTHTYLQTTAVSALNQHLTIRNWLFGQYIVEYEQNGEDRAKYGTELMRKLADFKGVDPKILLSKLSFTHIIELVRVVDPLKRSFYEIQAIRSNWSVKELQRQIGSMLYERTGLSADKKGLLLDTHKIAEPFTPEGIMRDPYVFEFVGLKPKEKFAESNLEEALINHLQLFLLELGKGFCFEDRQKRLTIDGEYYYVDLVFYHRILKCHILIDLKIREFKHTDAGQMNFYLNYYRDMEIVDGDNPPVGIVLCTDKKSSAE